MNELIEIIIYSVFVLIIGYQTANIIIFKKLLTYLKTVTEIMKEIKETLKK